MSGFILACLSSGGCTADVAPKAEALKACDAYLSAGFEDNMTTVEQRKTALTVAVSSATRAAASSPNFSTLRDLLRKVQVIAANHDYAYDSLNAEQDLDTSIADHCRDDAGQPP